MTAVLGTLRGRMLVAELTEDDALWTARACVGEGGEGVTEPELSALVSTLLRRFAVLSDAQLRSSGALRWGSFGAFVRAFSQPVNPRWADRGTAEQQARRARIASLTWAEIPRQVAETVHAYLSGQRALTVPGAFDWGALSLYTSYGARASDPSSIARAVELRESARGTREPAWVSTGGPLLNVFISSADSRAYGDPVIAPVGQVFTGDVPTGARKGEARAGSGPLLAVALGALAYFAARGSG